MNPLSPLNMSLYELALGDAQASPLLQVSPTTFKSMLGSFLGVLIDQHIPATLWLKLPKGEAWTAEIQRYQTAATASYTLYLLGNSLAANAMVTDTDRAAIAEPHHISAKTLVLPLGAETPLRREYLLLIISDKFCSLLVAHRPRNLRQKAESSPSNPSSAANDGLAEGGLEDELERRHPLNTLCSFDRQAMQRVLKGLGRAISSDAATMPFDPAYSTIEGLVERWQSQLSEFSESALHPDVLSYLFTKQIQTQEEMWQSTTIHRRQAEVATLLQMENEEFQNAIRLKDEFLTTVGQELRTPLATMKTALSLLNSPSLKSAQRQRYLDMLAHECDRQSSLITSVLDLLQLEKVDDRIPTQPLRLQDIVPGIVSTYQPLAQEKGIVMAYMMPDELSAVACTPSWLRQILINLLHNGIKFTQSGGRVWVTAKPQGDYVQVEVRDTGVGISQSDIPKIFDRFYRIRPVTNDVSGSGLGLSIVQQLLLRCGGSISVKSKLGEGSAFSILLPIYR